MDKIEIIQQQHPDGSMVDYVTIDRGNGEYTSMLKSYYDEQQAALSTPMVLDEAPSK
jgi:hypothetical protein